MSKPRCEYCGSKCGGNMLAYGEIVCASCYNKIINGELDYEDRGQWIRITD